MFLGLTLAVALAAPPCKKVHVEARLTPDLSRIEGTATCTVTHDTLDLAVATYPRTLKDPQGLSDISRAWYYPNGESPADMLLWRDEHALTSDAPAWQALGVARTDEVVTLRFATTVPERMGTFGRHRQSAYLLGGWHPAFGRAGEPLSATPFTYRITVPPKIAGFVGTTPFGHTSARVIKGESTGAFVPLFVTPNAQVDLHDFGVLMSGAPKQPRSQRGEPAWHLRELFSSSDTDARQEIVRTLGEGLAVARDVGLATKPLVVLVGPLRDRLVEPFDGGFMVSDRAFHVMALTLLSDLGIVPREFLLRFHRLAVLRAQFRALALSHARHVETSLAPELAAEAVAAALRDREIIRRYGEKVATQDYLETFAVIPEVDALIFAPQVSFVDAYFEAVDDTAPVRRRLDDFAHTLPSGKLLYEKLLDRLGDAAVQTLTSAYLRGHRPYLEVASDVGKLDASLALSPWLGPTPLLDYVLGAVHYDATGATVEVLARGPSAEGHTEPVTVLLEDDDGQLHTRTTSGPGALHFPGVSEPDRVELDPRGRLTQLIAEEGYAPRFNDRTPSRWRFLLNNFSGLVGLTNQQIFGSVNFTLRRIHDLRYRYDFDVFYDPQSYGAGTTASYGFGRGITALRLAERVGIGLTGERLTLSATPRFAVTTSAFYHYDTRESAVSSFQGQGLSARATASFSGTGKDERFTQLSVAAFHIFPWAYYHALFVRLRGDISFGEPPKEQRLRLGGRYTGGRGYEIDEAVGTRRAILSAEDRHAFVTDARNDLLGLFTLTRIEGALFADAIYMPVSRDGCQRDTFYDVGYGLRFVGEVLSISPTSVAVDVGVPLVRCASERDRLPVTVYLAFVQSFFSF